MMTLTEFLLARIAEDEALWKLAVDADLAFVAGPGRLKAVPPTGFSRRMLAECAAKRAIVDEYDRCTATALADEDMGTAAAHTSQGVLYALCSLAAVYADHPDYRDEWRP